MATISEVLKLGKGRKQQIEDQLEADIKGKPAEKKPAEKKKGSSYADNLYKKARSEAKRNAELERLKAEKAALMKELEKYKKETY